ncbi:WYL domain-containing protein [Streptomyces caniscabiei]|uniref:helix-turn-helix transcriptional regulator n=3 Tax=Streptomyces caniscabiei TaxID=2746961 RepID=UPI0029B07116|nr:WYL domain-containing protein [Streptomyces caniscabiei]MDX2601256.1 WYL domain-containing protein [Streptomyces caniscabiei]MDX2738928.1 WYL domain-containing protein [Streptomyces caniscabiei]
MLETSGRLLKLLALLQSHRDRDRSGAELAEQLGVSRRTLRRDVERLRDLGYPVHAARGAAGYRLGAGASLPPLLLDDEEAVAVVVGLRTAAEGTVTGIEEASLRALGKLEQVLPSRLRHRVTTLHRATDRAGAAPAPKVSPDTLMAIAEACRRHERLRFDYASPHSSTPDPAPPRSTATPTATTTPTPTRRVRTVEPHRLVSFDRHWYLVAWDLDRADWRTFRVDRLVPRTPTGPRFVPRALPDGDAATYLAHRLSSRAWPFRATVTLHEPAASVAGRLWPGMGVLEPLDDDRCLLHLGAETPRDLAWMITSVDTDFTLDAAAFPELADALRAQAVRSLAAIRRP